MDHGIEYARQFPALAAYMDDADHIDIKHIDARLDLRAFVAATMTYEPGWMVALYRIRERLVRVLGIPSDGVPIGQGQTRPEDLVFAPGGKVSFFNTLAAEEDRFWLGAVDDTHLSAGAAIVAEPLGEGVNRFYTITVVHYHNQRGRVYFNIIRPFHHLVVYTSMRSAIRRSHAAA
ncbi:DUF2867 domain-containing protein [Aggregatilinea lenta]|jgi:hypothetical protein|uniref:DUF2867 domain-containing protein n=1 Tax=Aggregatilinea lenta TaxID=913108 RepID=UPI000E5C493A|nr:DUF2867 domain-containing protein [Aggregatilinea lenta]